MGRALQVVTGRATNPGAAITALTPNTGDSFAVRSFDFASGAFLEEVWALGATPGVVRVRSPRMHDQAQGLRLRYLAANPAPLVGMEARQRLYPQDQLVAEISGGAAEVDLAAFLLSYADLPGIAAQLATWEQIRDRIVNLVGVERNVVTGGTAGDYGGGGALNANFDTLKRNVSYALLGYLTDTAVGVVGFQGPDTGNLRVGGPGTLRSELTSRWFVYLAQSLGAPAIPIINAANVAATLVDVAHTATAAAVNVVAILGELSGSVV